MPIAHLHTASSEKPVSADGPTLLQAEVTTGSTPRSRAFERALHVALGVSFHVLATPKITGVEMRIGVSDLLLGAGLLLLTWRYFRASSKTPPGAPAASYVWLVGMFSILLWAYLRVGIYDDSSALWAQIKLVGFVVLSAYFVLGSWIASTAGYGGSLAVARGFVAGAWAASVLGIVEYGAHFYFGYPIPWLPRPAALAENPNAYGVMLTAALALDFGTVQHRPLFSNRLRLAGTALMIVAIFLSASRSAYLGLMLGLTASTLFTTFNLRQLLRPVLAAVALFIVLFVVPPRLPGLLGTAPTSVSGSRSVDSEPASTTPAVRQDNYVLSRDHQDHGFNTRLDLFQQAMRMWWERPVFGAGLGAFWRAQQARNVPFPFVNHNTTLWLASETGLVGVVLFMGGALIATAILVRHRQTIPLAGGIAGVMFVMFGASLGMEVTYQRYTWCFCGLGLALVGRAGLRGNGHVRSSSDTSMN